MTTTPTQRQRIWRSRHQPARFAWKRCDVKSTNLLANVIANEAAHRTGLEALLVDAEGLVTEASHSSVLWVRGGVVEGTPEGPGILPGTTRLLTLRLCDRSTCRSRRRT